MSSGIDSQATVGQIVKERPARSRVFESLDIDYCCGGKLSLAEACGKRGLDVSEVVDLLAQRMPGPSRATATWSMPMRWVSPSLLITSSACITHFCGRSFRVSIRSRRKSRRVHGRRRPAPRRRAPRVLRGFRTSLRPT